jgi:hypothetical protein
MREISSLLHERLWRICQSLVAGTGARAAVLCDTASGSLLVSVGDAGAQGVPQGVESLGPGERLVRGEAGQMYGVDLPGGALLAVLHGEGELERVRGAAALVTGELAQLLREAPERIEEEDAEPHEHPLAAPVEAAPVVARAAPRKKVARKKAAVAKKATPKKKVAAKKKASSKARPSARGKAQRKPRRKPQPEPQRKPVRKLQRKPQRKRSSKNR